MRLEIRYFQSKEDSIIDRDTTALIEVESLEEAISIVEKWKWRFRWWSLRKKW